MLRTNLSAAGRDLYDNNLLNILVIASFNSVMTKVPIGGYTYTMWFRVAGRVDPPPPVPPPIKVKA